MSVGGKDPRFLNGDPLEEWDPSLTLGSGDGHLIKLTPEKAFVYTLRLASPEHVLDIGSLPSLLNR